MRTPREHAFRPVAGATVVLSLFCAAVFGQVNTATATGLQGVTRSGVPLTAGQTLDLEFKLAVGNTQQAITGLRRRGRAEL